MSQKVTRSARGEVVDFDLIAIKQQLAAAPVPQEVQARREFVEIKEGITKPKKDSTEEVAE